MGTSLTGTRISDTYDGLLKTTDNEPLTSNLKEITDGLGNDSGVHMDQNGNLKAEGTLEFGSLKDTGEDITVEKFVDEADGIANNDNDTTVPTSAAVKDYVDTKVTAEDLDFQGDNGSGAVDLDSQSLEIAGGTGIETTAADQTLTIDIDSTVATLDGTQTLTNKSIDLTDNTLSGTTAEFNSALSDDDFATLAGTETLTNKTIDADDNTVSNLETDNLKAGVLDTDLSNVSTQDDTLASAKAIKTYVDAAITAEDLDFSGNTGSGAVDLDTQTFAITGSGIASTTAADQGLEIDVPATNLSNTPAATTLEVESSTGSDTTLPAATTSLAGVMTAADKTKLDGIETGAEVNVVTSVNTETGDVVLDTDDISEGASNLYYTDTRADARVDLQTGTNLDLSQKSTTDLSEGTNLYYTEARVSANTDVTANTAKNSYPSADATKVGHITVTQAVDLDTMESDISTNASNISTNTSNISTNTSNISTNTSNISSNTTAITGKVAKAGDTMTGNLALENTSTPPKITIGDTDNLSNTQSGANLEIGNRISNGLAGGTTINLINGSYSQGSIQFRHGNTSTITDPMTMISSNYTGSGYNLKFEHYNGSTVDNYTTMESDHTYFNQPIRIGANAAANELDDYEEGDWTPTIAGFMGGITGRTYTVQTGKYTKIGNLVRLNFRLYFTATIGTSGNTVFIGGLPFTPDSTFDDPLVSFGNKSNVDFTYNAGFGRVSLSVIGARKFIGSEFTISCDDGNSIDNLTTDALKGSSSSTMSLEGGFLYKTT